MTSRRTFLGLMAAVAVPVALKAAAQPQYASGGILVEGRAWSRAVVGKLSADGGFAAPHAAAFRQFISADKILSAPQMISMRQQWDAPNRLYGTEINEDGDAI